MPQLNRFECIPMQLSLTANDDTAFSKMLNAMRVDFPTRRALVRRRMLFCAFSPNSSHPPHDATCKPDTHLASRSASKQKCTRLGTSNTLVQFCGRWRRLVGGKSCDCPSHALDSRAGPPAKRVIPRHARRQKPRYCTRVLLGPRRVHFCFGALLLAKCVSDLLVASCGGWQEFGLTAQKGILRRTSALRVGKSTRIAFSMFEKAVSSFAVNESYIGMQSKRLSCGTN